MVPGYGSGNYKVAAADTLRRTRLFLETPNSSAETGRMFVSTVGTPPEAEYRTASTFAGDRFFLKFKSSEQALSESNEQLFLHLDADASITQAFSTERLIEGLGEKSIAMVQQTRVVSEHPLGIRELYEHYLQVSSRAVNTGASKPTLEKFKYFNTGFVLFRRKALENFLFWAYQKLETLPREIDGHMIADQDLIQVYVNEIAPDEVAELDWSWNHCQWWDEDFPNPEAKVLHMSNFCQGPAAAQMNRLASLSRTNEARNFSDLTVLVVTHNSDAVLDGSIAALLEIPGVSIMIVDNQSKKVPSYASNPRVQVVTNKRNLGYSKAVNTGLREVAKKYVCLLNPDAFLSYEAADEALGKLTENPNQILAPNLFDHQGRFTESLRQGYSLQRLIDDLIPNPSSINRRIANKLLGPRNGEDFFWLIGACVFSTKDFLLEIGGLDESYFLYMEDVELGRRANGKGEVKNLESSIEHLGSQSTDKSHQFISHELAIGRLKYLRRRFGVWAWFVVRTTYALHRISIGRKRG